MRLRAGDRDDNSFQSPCTKAEVTGPAVPHEREEIEGLLAQIEAALDLLREPGETSDED